MKELIPRPVQDLSWVVETRGVTLFGSPYVSLPYPHAGLWALIADENYSLERARSLMAILMGTDERKAEHEVLRTIGVLQQMGFVEVG